MSEDHFDTEQKVETPGEPEAAHEALLKPPTPGDLRDALTDMVVRDLLCPAEGPEEELDQREDHVYTRYLVGMLAPLNSEVAAEESDELATTEGDEGEDGKAESGVPAGNKVVPRPGHSEPLYKIASFVDRRPAECRVTM